MEEEEISTATASAVDDQSDPIIVKAVTKSNVVVDDRGLTERQQKIIGTHKLTPKDLEQGFGFHTHRSLELAIRAAREPSHICKCVECHEKSDKGSTTRFSQSSSFVSDVTYTKIAERDLRFLMGLSDGEEEGTKIEEFGVIEQPSEDYINGGSEAMRNAQRYLREHRIFEFFQFLIAHLLSETPFDPINYLINILDKCLIYRSGISEPPLLYSKKHIECLFNLMDRMRTGFIDLQQYETGMRTFGIKSFNPKPPTSSDGQVPKMFFIEEAYECLKDLLNDMIRRRPRAPQKYKKVPKAPPPSKACSGLRLNLK